MFLNKYRLKAILLAAVTVIAFPGLLQEPGHNGEQVSRE
jgi:hypothetical protein